MSSLHKEGSDVEVQGDVLTFDEFCKYMKIGKTKGKELIKEHHGFAFRIGYRHYINKRKLDKWIDSQCR
jgi:excisionase family DNA binding protein